MPTIAELPPAVAVSAADDVPISQAGIARATSVGVLLASTQPAIIVDSPSLLGRTSVGSGGPEEVDVGLGISLASGTLVADGSDHAAFAITSGLSIGSDLVISNQGSPMLMQTTSLRGLFSAGQNVAIDSNGVISSAAMVEGIGDVASDSSIGELQVLTVLTAQDLVAVSHAGSNAAIEYSNLLGGLTIDQAQVAGPVGDSDAIWAAQGSNVMASQSFSAVWAWVASKFSTYKFSVIELTSSISLDTTLHNGRILVCSQPLTLTPLTNNMGSGFQCTVINASTDNVTLGVGFISSSGILELMPWQSAVLCCATYSGGTMAFAAMPPTATLIAVPGQVNNVSASAITSSTVTVSWQVPAAGGAVAAYVIQYRPTGAISWSNSAAIIGDTNSYELTALLSATSYDIAVMAQNAIGLGPGSTILTVVTSATS